MKTIVINGNEYGPFKFEISYYLRGETPCVRLTHFDKVRQYWEPLATATTNVPGLTESEVAIKNYGENDGIEEELIRLGLLDPVPFRSVPTGFTRVNIYIFHPERFEQFNRDVEDELGNQNDEGADLSDPVFNSLQDAMDFLSRESVEQHDNVTPDFSDVLTNEDIDELLETGSVVVDYGSYNLTITTEVRINK